MAMWSQLLLQEGYSPIMQLLSCFHDFTLAIIMLILTFVTGVSVFMIMNKFISNSPVVTLVEIVWTIMPILILLTLAIPSLQILYYMEENDPFLTLKVIGHQWYWSYEMMDLDIEYESYMLPKVMEGEFRLLESDLRVILPINKDIRALITSSDVIHSWALPSLGVKADAVPGRLNQVFMNIMRPALIYGQCSEICGANHSFMPITTEAVTLNNFMEWISDVKAA